MPLGRPKCRHSSTNCMLRSKTCTRLFERSATNSRPCESNASACGPMNSPGPGPILPYCATKRAVGLDPHQPIAILLRVGRSRPVPVGHDDVAVGRDRARGRTDERLGAGLRDAGLAERQQHLAVGAELEQLEPAPLGRGIVLRTDRCRPPRSCRRGPDRIRAPARTCRCRTGDRRCPTRRCAESAAPIGDAARCRPCRPG